MTPLGELKIFSGYPAISKCRTSAEIEVEKLESLLERYSTDDTSIVVFGSLARYEWTADSDLDWTLLVDGIARPEHFKVALRISKKLERAGYRAPSPSGAFGHLAFSHDIIHQIGGERDSNRNTTQRVLLVLESLPLGRREAYDRVVDNALNRYLELAEGAKPRRRKDSPRFLLNDIVRFWRTMAVDFANKQWERGGDGWGIRNIKLRMSRKLIFASGLLTCLDCFDSGLSAARLRRHIRQQLSLTPLENVAQLAEKHNTRPTTLNKLFEAYDSFLSCISSPEKRSALESLRAESAESSEVFREMRDVSDKFQEALLELFFGNDSKLRRLTEVYGVF